MGDREHTHVKILDLKKISDVKCIPSALSGRLDIQDGKISELEEIAIETIQNEIQREKGEGAELTEHQ